MRFFLISEIHFSDIRNLNSWYQKMIFWYEEFEFLISKITNHFLISKNIIFDIKIFWYQVFEYFISSFKNSFYDIKKYLLFSDIKNLISWYQKIYFIILTNVSHFVISKNRIFNITNSFNDIRNLILFISQNDFIISEIKKKKKRWNFTWNNYYPLDP